MTTHRFKLVILPRSIGYIPADDISSLSSSNPLSIKKAILIQSKYRNSGLLTKLISDKIGLGICKELYHLFFTVIYVTEKTFVFFEHPAWMEFFSKLRPNWHAPSAPVIGGQVLNDICEEVMKRAVKSIRQLRGCVMNANSVTDDLVQMKSNVILYVAVLLFDEYLRLDLKRETTANMVRPIGGAMQLLNHKTNIKSIFSFINASCNGVRAVCRTLVNGRMVWWAFWCVFHCFINFCENVNKDFI